MPSTSVPYNKRAIPPSLWWLLVFLPALTYFVGTRWPTVISYIDHAAASAVQQHSTDCTARQQEQCLHPWKVSQLQLVASSSSSSNVTISRERLEHLMLITTTTSRRAGQHDSNVVCDLWYPVERISSFSFASAGASADAAAEGGIVSSIWREDEDLGRGYLLVSEGNRIWRWERGGGPIAVGKTLALEYAGCRPDHTCRDKTTMVGGMTMDFFSSTTTIHAGDLIVAERGEQRIIRLESDTGARTPLALWPQTPPPQPQKQSSSSSNNSHSYHHRPHQLLMTPNGDLLLLEHGLLYRLNQAMTIPPLESLHQSRLAHNPEWIQTQWTLPDWNVWQWLNQDTTNTTTTRVVVPTGMTLESHNSIYISATSMSPVAAALLYELPCTHDKDDSDDDDVKDDTPPPQATLILNLTHQFPEWTRAGPLAVTNSHVLFWVVNDSTLVVLEHHQVLGYITLPQEITSLTLAYSSSVLFVTTLSFVWKWTLPFRIAKPITISLHAKPKQRQPRPPQKQEQATTTRIA